MGEQFLWRWDGDCMHVFWIFGVPVSHEDAEPEQIEAYNRLAAAGHEQKFGCDGPIRLTASSPLSDLADADDG